MSSLAALLGSSGPIPCPVCGSTICSREILRAQSVVDFRDENVPERMYQVRENVIENGQTVLHSGQMITLAEAVKRRLPGAITETVASRKPMHSSEDRAVQPSEDR